MQNGCEVGVAKNYMIPAHDMSFLDATPDLGCAWARRCRLGKCCRTVLCRRDADDGGVWENGFVTESGGGKVKLRKWHMEETASS